MKNTPTPKNNFEVIIIGGSYAGLSAALALGRSLREVLIIDNELPCNRQTPHSQNFLTQDGKTPKEISTIAREQVAKYETIQFYQGKAISGNKTETGFEITTDKNEKFTGKKLIFATGIKDEFPAIEGFSECWGISVIHCPYCHGYEYREKNTAIIANGERAFHLASMVHQLTYQITLFTSCPATFNTNQREKLEEKKIKIIETEITEILHESGQLKNIVLKDGTSHSFDVAYAAIPFVQNSEIPSALGCELTENGHLQIDLFQKTNIAGVFACGDNSNMMRSVAQAVYSGNVAGAMVNAELVKEEF